MYIWSVCLLYVLYYCFYSQISIQWYVLISVTICRSSQRITWISIPNFDLLVNDTRRIIGYFTVNIERVSDWYCFITIVVKLNNERYIFCYCILNYDDSHIFDLYVSYMVFMIIVLTNFESVIRSHFCHNCFESGKELQKVPFPI